ncbi:MAG: hypothetical protein WCJ67_01275 [Thermoleophilia bacterium]
MRSISRPSTAIALTAISAVALVFGVATGAPAVATPSRVIHVDLAKASPFALSPTLRRSATGRVTFVVRNDGTSTHEFVVIRLRPGQTTLPVSGAKVSEQGRAGETGDLAAHATKRLTLRLAPGRYALVCNLPGHYAAGMHSTFVVA